VTHFYLLLLLHSEIKQTVVKKSRQRPNAYNNKGINMDADAHVTIDLD
jgi:hypothetical protein